MPAVKEAAEPASVSGAGAQASAQDRRLSAYKKLLALGEKILAWARCCSLQLFEAGLASGKGFPLKCLKSLQAS